MSFILNCILATKVVKTTVDIHVSLRMSSPSVEAGP